MKTQDVVVKLIEISKSPETPMEEIVKLVDTKHPVVMMFMEYIESGGGHFNPLFESMCLTGIPFTVEEEVFWEKCKELVSCMDNEVRMKLVKEIYKTDCAPLKFLSGLRVFQKMEHSTYLSCISSLLAHGAIYAGLHVNEAIKCCQQAESDASN